MHDAKIQKKNQTKIGAINRITYLYIVKVYVKELSPFAPYYITAGPMYKIHLRTRLSRDS